MDALDPNDGVDFAAGLYNSSLFELSLKYGLTENGILVAQLGLFETPRSFFPRHHILISIHSHGISP
jgi:hypothetical protein